MQGILVLVEKKNILCNAVVELVVLLLSLTITFVFYVDGNARFRKASSRSRLERISNLKSRVSVNISGSGLKTPCSGLLCVTDDLHLLGGLALGELHLMNLAIAPYLGLNHSDTAFAHFAPTP